jgi:predicted aldo/keto reductase-like oxidoreductase
MEECNRASAELDEHYMMMVESLEQQMMDEIEMEQFGLEDSLSIRYDEYDVQYTELLIQLSEAEDEDEAALIIQEIQSLRESEQQVIEWVTEVYHTRIAEIVEQYNAMIEALDDEAFESLRQDVETDCETLFEELEEQFRAEYEALESMTEVEDENSCVDDERCTNRDENYMEEFGIGHSVPGFTGLLSVLAITGAVLLTGRRGLHETRGRA